MFYYIVELKMKEPACKLALKIYTFRYGVGVSKGVITGVAVTI